MNTCAKSSPEGSPTPPVKCLCGRSTRRLECGHRNPLRDGTGARVQVSRPCRIAWRFPEDHAFAIRGSVRNEHHEVTSSDSPCRGLRGRRCHRRDGRPDRGVRWQFGEGSRNVDHHDRSVVVSTFRVSHREVDQPHGRQPLHASGQGAARADGHSWQPQLTSRGLEAPSRDRPTTSCHHR
jgi:hypothetical protein